MIPPRRPFLFALLVAVLLGLAVPSSATVFDAISLGVARPGANTEGALVLTTDQALLTAPTLVGANGLLFGLTRNPVTGELYTEVLRSNGSFLARIDPHAGTLTIVGPDLGMTLRSIAFDSHGNLFGFVYCDQVYDNQLVQIDTQTWTVTGTLGSLDVTNVADCSRVYTGAAIAVDPTDDTLYLAANSTNGGVLVDRFDAFLVPTTLVNGSPGAVALFPGFVVTGATFADGLLWVAQNLDFNGPGFLFGLPPDHVDQATFGGAYFDSQPFGSSAPILGLAQARQPCVDTPSATCLYGRFRVEVSYDARPAGGNGVAKPTVDSVQTALYAFSNPKETDLVVRMVNACSTAAKRWRVWGGGPTNVGVQIKVTDTRTGKFKTYANAKGKLFQTFFDASAFLCP